MGRLDEEDLRSFVSAATGAGPRHRPTIRAFSSFRCMTLNACSTQRPAIMAFVVAIAGIMFPAISARCQRVQTQSKESAPSETYA